MADARENAGTVRAPVEIVATDATQYELPDDVTIIFMFCPFTGSVFEQVIERVLASVSRAQPALARSMDRSEQLR